MPFTVEMRRAVEQIRDYLYGGGYPDPVNNAEQLSFLFFFYLAEGLDAQRAARARVARKARESMFAGEWKLRNPLNAQSFGGKKTIPRESLRWSVWAKGLSGEPLVRFVRDEVFPFFAEFANGSAVNFMDGARLR
jgi:type I restriction enzyme M protein